MRARFDGKQKLFAWSDDEVGVLCDPRKKLLKSFSREHVPNLACRKSRFSFFETQVAGGDVAVVEDTVQPRTPAAAAWMNFTRSLYASAEFRFVR